MGTFSSHIYPGYGSSLVGPLRYREVSAKSLNKKKIRQEHKDYEPPFILFPDELILTSTRLAFPENLSLSGPFQTTPPPPYPPLPFLLVPVILGTDASRLRLLAAEHEETELTNDPPCAVGIR